jgi:hypothetical protein
MGEETAITYPVYSGTQEYHGNSVNRSVHIFIFYWVVASPNQEFAPVNIGKIDFRNIKTGKKGEKAGFFSV